MRFYAKQHQACCGIDLPARTMDLCILNQDGEIMLLQNMQTCAWEFRAILSRSIYDRFSYSVTEIPASLRMARRRFCPISPRWGFGIRPRRCPLSMNWCLPPA
jgi:hypothetical protein